MPLPSRQVSQSPSSDSPSSAELDDLALLGQGSEGTDGLHRVQETVRGSAVARQHREIARNRITSSHFPLAFPPARSALTTVQHHRRDDHQTIPSPCATVDDHTSCSRAENRSLLETLDDETLAALATELRDIGLAKQARSNEAGVLPTLAEASEEIELGGSTARLNRREEERRRASFPAHLPFPTSPTIPSSFFSVDHATRHRSSPAALPYSAGASFGTPLPAPVRPGVPRCPPPPYSVYDPLPLSTSVQLASASATRRLSRGMDEGLEEVTSGWERTDVCLTSGASSTRAHRTGH
ncbi:hypothetical protein JCM11641_008368 [Rhodosporidiobolus odoratus]